MKNFSAHLPLSLYIHLPWCVRKCPYCDFNSHTAEAHLPEDAYVAALLADFREQLPTLTDRSLISIFFGGGTPSLFSSTAIEKIVRGIQREMAFDPAIEITLEANPGTVDESRFQGFRQAGINRLSIGLQSLQNDKLQALGRIHNRDYALRAIEAAQRAGFTNFNVDLMHGLPGQSVQDALQDLQDALVYSPPHLSWYQLTIEPNTLFHHQRPTLPQEDVLWSIQEEGQKILAAHDLSGYEISAYSRAGHQCVHNTNYWEFGDYVGIGAGAHSKITNINQQIITRHWQVKNPRDYLAPTKQFVATQTVLTENDIRFEFMLNALRLAKGVPAALFPQRTGLNLTSLEPMLSFAKEKRLLVDDDHLICATALGQRFLNDVISLFL